MRKITFILIVVFIQSSCSAQKPLKFVTHKSDYFLDLPSGYELRKLKDDDGYQEYQAMYPDGSIVYITDDNKSGGSMNKAKEEKYGTNVYLQILSSDTLTLKGEHLDGKVWREDKLDKVVIGYIDVPISQKDRYDKILATLRRKK